MHQESKSFAIALSLIGGWIVCLVSLLSIKISSLPFVVMVAGVAVQTAFFTGLFVTVHDAIHGSICPSNRFNNHCLGRLCAKLYACLSYDQLAVNHRQHHLNPMKESDPDRPPSETENFWSWYFQFMKRYWHWTQLSQICGLIILLHFGFQIKLVNLILFWALPLFLSSLQLFYFGTYRPHREIDQIPNPACARTEVQPWLLSLLTCYHFSYHQEHHDQPHVPWWNLPRLYERS